MRIALLDDCPGDVRWFQLALDDLAIRAELVTFQTAVSAIEYFQSSRPPDLIVSDWKLPVWSFPEFMQRLRAIPLYENVPVVVLTGVAYLISKEVFAAGAICCLNKPVDVEQLHEIVAPIWMSAAKA